MLTSWRSQRAARPGSSEVEQPPCKRPVGGSNPFPGSRWRSPLAPAHLLKSRWRLLPYSGAPHRVPRGAWPGVCPSGQREQTVNLPASPTEVRILPPPRKEYAPVAQSVEHFHGKEGVSGSSPLGGSGIGVYSIYDIGVAV